MKSLLLVALPFLLVPASPAQGCFFDPDPDPATGAVNVIPFGDGSATWNNQRCQNLITTQYLPAIPGLLTAVGFASSASNSGALYSSMELRVGHNSTGTLGTTFASNYSAPEMVVFQQASFSWVLTAKTWCRIPFQKPFIYNGKEHLVVDVIALGSSLNVKSGFYRSSTIPRVYNLSYSASVTTGTGPTNTGQKTALYFGNACALPYGVGCPGSTTAVPGIVAETAPSLNTVFRVGLTNALALTPAVLNLGRSRTAWGASALPLSLGPYGAAGCELNASLVFLFPRATDPTGYAFMPLPIPGDPALDGAQIYLQWLVVDPTANGLGLVATKGLDVLLGR